MDAVAAAAMHFLSQKSIKFLRVGLLLLLLPKIDRFNFGALRHQLLTAADTTDHVGAVAAAAELDGVDDDAGVAMPDVGAQRLSPYPLDDGINIWSFLLQIDRL